MGRSRGESFQARITGSGVGKRLLSPKTQKEARVTEAE